VDHQWRPALQTTVDSILAAMGATSDGPPPASAVTVRLDQPMALPPGRLTLQDGAAMPVGGPLPTGLPPGYHHLQPDDGPGVMLIASPGRCPLPATPTWGFSAQLYATRSRRSWGVGDLDDLKQLSEWSRSLGAGFVLVNPLHAVSPTRPHQPSPYFPGSRCFLNPIYLAVEAIPGVASGPEVAGLARAGQALNNARLIDRDRVWELKSPALEAGFAEFPGDPEFDTFLTDRGTPLRGFATFCALAERHGSSWTSWPPEWQDPTSRSVREFAASAVGSARIRYYAWLQWQLDQQLATAARNLPVVTDLAVGVDPGGPDAWLWREAFVDAMRIGAPPDRFNTLGQDWALLPFNPWGLRAHAYEPWIQSLRGAMRHGGGLRLDHVMGLFRLYWVPQGATPREGAYVRYPADDLLNLVALEAHRARAWVVGEDLGTVEEGARLELSRRHVLSYKVWWFEADPPSDWPAQALGAISTHDLPTVAGVAGGADLAAQHRLDLEPDIEAAAELHDKLMSRTGSDEDTPAPEVVARVYADLGTAPCLLLAASLDDALALDERPNMPGTTDEWPNWRLALPVTLEEIEQMALPRRVAASLSRPGPAPRPSAMSPEAGGDP
jgi:4-alpha-glucanotransferase